jgi:hypothetical protein
MSNINLEEISSAALRANVEAHYNSLSAQQQANKWFRDQSIYNQFNSSGGTIGLNEQENFRISFENHSTTGSSTLMLTLEKANKH